MIVADALTISRFSPARPTATSPARPDADSRPVNTTTATPAAKITSSHCGVVPEVDRVDQRVDVEEAGSGRGR